MAINKTKAELEEEIAYLEDRLEHEVELHEFLAVSLDINKKLTEDLAKIPRWVRFIFGARVDRESTQLASTIFNGSRKDVVEEDLDEGAPSEGGKQ